MASLPFVLLISFSSLFLFEEISAANPRLRRAYTALQAWKRVMYSDPKNTTSNWRGPEVCGYAGVYCAPAPQDNETITVAGVDLNGADIAGFLPEELGLLSDLALLHLNSNRFCGVVPHSLANLTLLFELDLSNNRFVGPFPSPVLDLPALKFLDIRYNEFEGPVPPQVFANGLDAVFVNNNRFASLSSFPSNASVAVLVLANNRFSGGKLPEGIGRLAGTLEELVATNANLAGCLPEEIGVLRKLRLLDVSSNVLDGALPYSMAGLQSLERLNVAHNHLSGAVPAGICSLPKLTNLTVSYNFLCGESKTCLALGSKKGAVLDDRRNCLPDRPFQRPHNVCQPFLSHCY